MAFIQRVLEALGLTKEPSPACGCAPETCTCCPACPCGGPGGH